MQYEMHARPYLPLVLLSVVLQSPAVTAVVVEMYSVSLTGTHGQRSVLRWMDEEASRAEELPEAAGSSIADLGFAGRNTDMDGECDWVEVVAIYDLDPYMCVREEKLGARDSRKGSELDLGKASEVLAVEGWSLDRALVLHKDMVGKDNALEEAA